LVLERLLDKGSIVVKKAYSDWDRYKTAKKSLHEAAFELIEIPHVSYSGKNSADIRLVVDALDLCYTKPHVGVFVVVSGDSDFSPLVSKLRENNKRVIGLGVKNSSSDLLVDNCDEFIYYDDLVRTHDRGTHSAKKSKERDREKSSTAQKPKKEDAADRKQEALDLVLDTVEALFRERDDRIWGSMIKQTLKRKRPHFSENFHGYRTFNELLEDARDRRLLELQKDERSGGYIISGFGNEA
jgi:uncharacterized protein (TIGR00288 family)